MIIKNRERQWWYLGAILDSSSCKFEQSESAKHLQGSDVRSRREIAVRTLKTIFPGIFMAWRTLGAKTTHSQETGGAGMPCTMDRNTMCVLCCKPLPWGGSAETVHTDCQWRSKGISYDSCTFGFSQGLNMAKLRWAWLLHPDKLLQIEAACMTSSELSF